MDNFPWVYKISLFYLRLLARKLLEIRQIYAGWSSIDEDCFQLLLLSIIMGVFKTSNMEHFVKVVNS